MYRVTCYNPATGCYMIINNNVCVFCSACTMSSQGKFTLGISSPDKFLVTSMICLIKLLMSQQMLLGPFYEGGAADVGH